MVTTIDKNTGIADGKMWEAVQNRDPRADGHFVYAVRSTGIYCRPTCPSRRPSPHRVAFFPRAVDAEAAGFRACKRCLPDQDSPNADLVRRVSRYIQEYSERSGSAPTLSELGRAIGSSPSHLQRVFKEVTGVTPRQYASARRMDRFKAMIKEGQDISTALYEAGFGSPSRLYENSMEQLGMTPGIYRRGGTGMNVYHTVVACTMGRLLVAATEQGVCSVKLGSSGPALEEDLLAEFPSANHQQDGGRLAIWAAEILSYLDGEKTGLDLPLDIRATAFQLQVWQMLRTISLRRDPHLPGGGPGAGEGRVFPSRRHGLRGQPGSVDRPLPSGAKKRRLTGGLPLGSGP